MFSINYTLMGFAGMRLARAQKRDAKRYLQQELDDAYPDDLQEVIMSILDTIWQTDQTINQQTLLSTFRPINVHNKEKNGEYYLASKKFFNYVLNKNISIESLDSPKLENLAKDGAILLSEMKNGKGTIYFLHIPQKEGEIAEIFKMETTTEDLINLSDLDDRTWKMVNNTLYGGVSHFLRATGAKKEDFDNNYVFTRLDQI